MNNLLLALKLIPVLIEAIRSIEAAIPGAGQGKAKLNAVLEIIEHVEQTARALPLEKIISTLVALFNVTGVFKKADLPT